MLEVPYNSVVFPYLFSLLLHLSSAITASQECSDPLRIQFWNGSRGFPGLNRIDTARHKARKSEIAES
jgi:hypothetical protein